MFLYQWITYQGDRRYYVAIHYETPEGPELKKVRKIYRKTNSCSRDYGCSYTEDFAVEIPEQLLRRLAAYYAPAAPKAWHFKFTSRGGAETYGAMNLAEIVAILATVDQYRASRKL